MSPRILDLRVSVARGHRQQGDTEPSQTIQELAIRDQRCYSNFEGLAKPILRCQGVRSDNDSSLESFTLRRRRRVLK